MVRGVAGGGWGAVALLLAAPAAAQQAVDPLSEMAPLPELGVAWPTLDPDPTAAADEAPADRETRYAWRIDGIDGIGTALLRQRFEEFSTLAQNRRSEANAAQLDRRAREDATLLVTLLRGEGYYDARVATRVEAGATPTVVLAADPGARYRFAAVTLAGVEAAGAKADDLRQAFGIGAGDPVDTDAIAAGLDALRLDASRRGFAFAEVGAPEIVVDRAARTATLDVPVTTGDARRFGQIRVAADNGVFGADHVADIARFRPGDPYTGDAVTDLRRALIQTGLVGQAEVTPVPGIAPGTVDLDVRLAPAPPRTIAGEIGYGTGEGARVEASWTHRNLFPPEGALTLRGVLGTREQLGSVLFRRSNFHARDRVLTLQIAAAHLLRDAYEANTFLLSGALERQTNIFFQKAWVWSLGAELVASDERDVIASTGAPRRRTFFIAAAPTSLTYDGSDDLLDPTRGFRLGGRFSPELSLEGAAFGYTRVQVDASAYVPVTRRIVGAARVRLGTILGAPRDAIAPSRRYYAGGGASVRGYSFQAIGPRDPNNDPVGGRSLTEFALEARVRAFGNFGIVPFVDAGTISTDGVPSLRDLRVGAGVGVRYYSSFGPIRVDVGTPINPQPGDPRVGVYVSLGQAF